MLNFLIFLVFIIKYYHGFGEQIPEVCHSERSEESLQCFFMLPLFKGFLTPLRSVRNDKI